MDQISRNSRLRIFLLVIVVAHLFIVAWHGVSHLQIPVPLSMLQMLFVGIVITLLPLIGAAMLWTKYLNQGAWLIATAMFASFLFGLINHFGVNVPAV